MTRYELLERIGVGGMAEIFRGKAIAGRGFEKPVAIKRILPHLSEDKRFVELLITEAKTLSELRHRNIVQIYDVGLGDDGQYFLVMEFVDGVDLADLYDEVTHRGERLSIEVSLYLGAEICEALQHAHLARDAEGTLVNLVHRDVSPSNILLSKSGEVKLTDFGIAKRVEELTGHGGVRGKFAYISPEQADNEHVDGRSDVHSLGMVLFELISGKRLFSDMPDFDALAAVREHRMPRLRDVDPSLDAGLEEVIMKSLEADPERRYQSAKEFATALRDYRYSMISSTGDPAQAVAKTVREVINPTTRRSQSVAIPEPVGEGTVVRILSSAGLGVPYDDIDTDRSDIDPYAGARRELDSYDDEGSYPEEPTMAARTPPPRRIRSSRAARAGARGKARASSEEGSTQIERPQGKKTTRRSSVDPDADTELAMHAEGLLDALDDDFDGELETRVLDRKDPKLMAAILRQAKGGERRAPLPPPSAGHDEHQATVPRADPVPAPAAPAPERPGARVRSDGRSAAPARSAPPRALAPQYPSMGPSELRGLGVIADDRILGMPRHIAYWVVGGVAALLLVIIIAVAAGGGDGKKGGDNNAPAPDVSIDGGNPDELTIEDD